ncbi:centrosomal protein of 170 kDa-like isoform X2 [Dysidea avara]|uniref:centrosomal protein of 170 kDa-like isoform X2 n=1 Tax=Dysidea avara TaxID=196820 RepID=UPI00332402CB
MMWALRHKDRHYRLSKSSISIGQGRECDVIIQSASVDAQHAALHYVSDMDQYIVRDLGSATGTYVNDQRVHGEQGVWLQSCDQLKCGRDAPVLTIERLFTEDEDDGSPPGSPMTSQSLHELCAPPTSSSTTQTSPEKFRPFCISPSMPVLPIAYCVPLTDHVTSSPLNFSHSLPKATVRAAWTAEDIDNAENRQPSSDLATDSSYHRQDGRRNVTSQRGSSLYGQPSWWTPPNENAPLTLQPIHSAVKWTEASPTPLKSGRGSTPADSKKRYSTPITKTTGASPRERSGSTKESKLTTRLMKKITLSTKKTSSSEGKTSTASSTTSSASTSSTDLTKGTGEKITRGAPRRQTYVKKASSRPVTTETASTTTHSTPQKAAQSTPQKTTQSTLQRTTQSTLQKPDTKFDRKSPQRHTYNKKQPTTAKDETSNTPKAAQKRPRETISELRQRMQQAKKAAQEANKDGESDVKIFVSASTPNLDHQDELHVDQVIDDEGSSNEVTSSGVSPNDVSNQSGAQRKQWGMKDTSCSMDHLTLASLQALSLHLSQLADMTCVKVKDFIESAVDRLVVPTEAFTNMSINTSPNPIPEWVGSHTEVKGVYRNLRSVESKLNEISQLVEQHNSQMYSSDVSFNTSTNSSS